ncbi:MAG: Ig domain-containing protein [bacterium]
MRKLRAVFVVLVGLGPLVLAGPSCSDDAVGGEPCDPGEVRCSGSAVEQCLFAGSGWQVVEQCADDESCVEGICLADACDPGTRLCAGDVVYECDADGLSWERSVCPEGTQCLLGECVECVRDEGCPAGLVCDQGQCVEPAVSEVRITTTVVPEGIVNVPYTTTLQATQGSEPYTWALASGALPAGVTLDASSGVISGTPTTAGDYDFVAEVTDSDSVQDTQALSLRVLGTGVQIITPSDLPMAEEGYAYETQLQAAGGLPPYAWMIIEGGLPSGLDLFADGRIAGIPTEVGSFPFVVRVFDNLEPAQDATKLMNLVVDIAPLVIVGDTEYNFYVTKIIVLNMIFPFVPYNDQLQALGGLKPYLWEEQPVPILLSTMLQLAGVDPSSWGVPTGLTLAQDGTLSGSKTDISDAQTLTIPVVNISVTGYFFYASVTDSQFPAESREAAFVIPTIPLSQP